MATKKLSPSEELEKQYRDYRAQFEEWKEKNRESVGTDAYISYVKQFEQWEKDVEKRRAALRQKAEVDKQAAEREAAAKSKRDAEERKREEAAARAYAEEQAQYMAIHQQAMREEQQQKQTRAQQQLSLQQQHLKTPLSSNQLELLASPVSDYKGSPVQHQYQQRANNGNDGEVTTGADMLSAMQQMFNIVMSGSAQQAIPEKAVVNGEQGQQHRPSTNASSHKNQGSQVLAVQQTEQLQPPQLWGSDGASFTQMDPMFRRWNVRAAPPNFRVPYQPPPPNTPITPCWLFLRKMEESKLAFAPSPNLNVPPPPIPAMSQLNMPPLAHGPPVPYIPYPGPMIPPPNLNIPPPMFKR